MTELKILWSIDPVMMTLALVGCLIGGFVYFMCLYGLMWNGGEDVLICEEK